MAASRVTARVGLGPYTSSVIVTNNSGTEANIGVSSDGCTAALVVPEEPAPDFPPPCTPTTVLAPRDRCTAYMAFEPVRVGAYAATLAVVPLDSPPDEWQWYRFVAAGLQNYVVQRRDPSGYGDFSGPTSPEPEIVSVGSDGMVMNGYDPSVSGDGRYVAFTSRSAQDRQEGASRQQLYRHDNQTGETELVSLLPDGELAQDSVVSPSLSADGERVAFATQRRGSEGVSSGQVYVRDIEAGETVLASATLANPDVAAGVYSGEPSLSDDGTTVAFSSTAGDLVAASNGEQSVYVRYVEPDFAGAPATERFNELVSVTQDGSVPPAGGYSRAPALDEDGSFTAFSSTLPLVQPDREGAEDVFVHRRSPLVSMVPVALDFGLIPQDSTSDLQTVTISNAGPGPVKLLEFQASSPFALGGESATDCASTLHRGEECTVEVTFAPLARGRFDDLMLMRTGQGYRAGPTDAVTLTGAVSVPGAAALSVVPGALSFGPHTLHVAGDPMPVTVRNVGAEPVRITTSVTSPAKDFTVRGTPCKALLEPRQECRVPVAFAPRRLGERLGSLVIRADAPDGEVTDPVPVTVRLTGSTITPTLESNPGLVRPGRVTQVIGRNFPPDMNIQLRWSSGIGTTKVDPSFIGRFETPMLVFKRDVLGPRELLAPIPGVGTIRSEPIFVVPLTGQPPDFVSRG